MGQYLQDMESANRLLLDSNCLPQHNRQRNIGLRKGITRQKEGQRRRYENKRHKISWPVMGYIIQHGPEIKLCFLTSMWYLPNNRSMWYLMKLLELLYIFLGGE